MRAGQGGRGRARAGLAGVVLAGLAFTARPAEAQSADRTYRVDSEGAEYLEWRCVDGAIAITFHTDVDVKTDSDGRVKLGMLLDDPDQENVETFAWQRAGDEEFVLRGQDAVEITGWALIGDLLEIDLRDAYWIIGFDVSDVRDTLEPEFLPCGRFETADDIREAW